MICSFFFRCTLILALVITSHLMLGQSGSVNNNPEYTITKRLLSIEDGLASHEVFCGVQDKAGFLWFGTRNGLNRYDGKNCLLFTRQRKTCRIIKWCNWQKTMPTTCLLNMAVQAFNLLLMER